MFLCRKLSKKKNCDSFASKLSTEQHEDTSIALSPHKAERVVIDCNKDGDNKDFASARTQNDDEAKNKELPYPASNALTRTSRSNSQHSIGSNGNNINRSRQVRQFHTNNKDDGSEISATSFGTRSIGSAGSNSRRRNGRVNQVYIGSDKDIEDLSASSILSPRCARTSRSTSSRSLGSTGSANSQRSRRVNQAYIVNDLDIQHFSVLPVLSPTVSPRSTRKSRSNSSRSLGSAESSNSQRSKRANQLYEEKKIDAYENIPNGNKNYKIHHENIKSPRPTAGKTNALSKNKSKRTTRVTQVYKDDVVQNMEVLSGEMCSSPIPKRAMVRNKSKVSIGSCSLSQMSSIEEIEEQEQEV